MFWVKSFHLYSHWVVTYDTSGHWVNNGALQRHKHSPTRCQLQNWSLKWDLFVHGLMRPSAQHVCHSSSMSTVWPRACGLPCSCTHTHVSSRWTSRSIHSVAAVVAAKARGQIGLKSVDMSSAQLSRASTLPWLRCYVHSRLLRES